MFHSNRPPRLGRAKAGLRVWRGLLEGLWSHFTHAPLAQRPSFPLRSLCLRSPNCVPLCSPQWLETSLNISPGQGTANGPSLTERSPPPHIVSGDEEEGTV